VTPSLDVHLTEADAAMALRTDVRTGLTATPKWLPPKWFYDATGSALFEKITELPEYYPTRAERAVLAERAGEFAAIAAEAGVDTLVELGSGSSEKTRLLLDALRATGRLRRFVPLDVSEAALSMAIESITADYPDLTVHGVVGDFTRHLALLPAGGSAGGSGGGSGGLGGGRRAVAFLGGTIGNLLPAERAAFLRQLRATLRPGELFLLGTDLVKTPEALVAAYDDAAGVTAEFNRNVLHVINRELSADFDVDAFEHIALWDAEREWIEMRLRASRPMRVRVAELGLEVGFAEGEELRTEVSAKFREHGVRSELSAAGLCPRCWWTDTRGRFAVSLSAAT
jgi:L-histidine Nalpha-methyltransferase